MFVVNAIRFICIRVDLPHAYVAKRRYQQGDTRGEKLVGYFLSQQHASVSQGRTCLDDCTCCHTETDQTCYLTQSRYADTGPTSSSSDSKPSRWGQG